MAKREDISLKGLDNFSKQFLLGSTMSAQRGDPEFITVGEGQKISPTAMKRYDDERAKAFMLRAGSFTEDLVAFIVEQKRLRDLDDMTVVFALALANINLRNAYGNPHPMTKKTTSKERDALLSEFDNICMGAQEYFDANAEDT